jgi:protein phosphatase
VFSAINMMDISSLMKAVEDYINDPDKIIDLIHDVDVKLTTSMEDLKYRPPGALEINNYAELYVLGDLHGDYATFITILEKEKILERIGGNNVKLILLGDYVDRGPQQLQVLVSIMYLKNIFPNNIVLIRGNHEPPRMLMPVPHDFTDIVLLRYGVEEGMRLLRAVFKMFQHLPYLARVPGKLLFLHGGPPRTVLNAKSYEEAFSIGLPSVDDIVLEDILWSDPVDDASIITAPSPRGAGVLYGPKVTERALELSGTQYIIRGHEPTEGFRLNHNRRVITLFDARIPVYGISRASYLKIRAEDDLADIRKYIHIIE